MKIEDILLKKEELPILNETAFYVPIHTKLLSSEVKIDENLARNVFPKAAEEWYNDLKTYSEQLPNGEHKDWINRVFLKKKPKVKQDYGNQILDTINWRDEVLTKENGFANLSINRNFGGSLYFNKDEMGNDAFVSFNRKDERIQFTKEKALEYGHRTMKLYNNTEGSLVYVYLQHNIDNYPGALFLRNWAILYLNEAMKQVLK